MAGIYNSSMNSQTVSAPNLTPAADTNKERKVYSGIAAKAMKLLANGATQSEVALALGVSDGLISQYMAEVDFKQQLLEIVTRNMEVAREIDDNYQEAEKVLSKRLKDQVAMMYNPDQVLRTLKFVNEAKRKAPAINGNNGINGNGGNGVAGIQPVVLVLPQVIRKEFVINPQNEIVGIGDKPLVTLNSDSLNQIVKNHKGAQSSEIADAIPSRKELPDENNKRKPHPDPYADL